MVHKSSIIPGLSKFIDENILVHYPPTAMKRILIAAGLSIYLKRGESVVDALIGSPLFTSLGVVHNGGMIDIDTIKEAVKTEVDKAGFMRVTLPVINDVDLTPEDIDALYKFVTEANTRTTQSISVAPAAQTTQNNGGVY